MDFIAKKPSEAYPQQSQFEKMRLALAQVRAKELVRDAKAASRKDPCRVLERIAEIPMSNADTPLHKVLRDAGLLFGMGISTAKVSNTLFYPYLDPREFLERLSAKGCFHKVVGLPVGFIEEGLGQYWDNFRLLFPNHVIFQQYIPLTRLIPYYLHGDGGRGFKKDAIEIISMFPCLGSGTKLNPIALGEHKRTEEGHVRMGINMRGNSGSTRFLFSVLGSSISKTDPAAFDALMNLWGRKLQSLFLDGFSVDGTTFHVTVIAFTGDSPFVKKVGKFTRSFNNVRKTHSSNRNQVGCCWLCQAGKETPAESIPFEHLGFSEPAWIATQGVQNVPLPWSGSGGPLLQWMMTGDDAPAFFRPDLFHVLHAGVGKDFVGSALVYAMKTLFGLGSIKKDLAELNLHLHMFLQVSGNYLHLGRNLTEDHLGYTGTRDYPEGHWSKNMDTATLMKFVVWLLQLEAHEEAVRADDLLPHILLAGIELGCAMKRLLESEYFMASSDCVYIIRAGHGFLMGYQHLANSSYMKKLCLFKFRPKIHYLNHIFLTIKEQWEASGTAINPCAEATFMSEDFVGFAARISRRVSAKAVAIKTLQRYDAWVQSLLNREELSLLDLSWLD